LVGGGGTAPSLNRKWRKAERIYEILLNAVAIEKKMVRK